MISLNNNLLARNTANQLTSHYGRLQTSMERLSSGLRINGAADDAAGLAIREMMRADIAALNQGVRNANDAISMIQTFDGALSVIDEKLIRMKELAEQAATGTYDSTQRLMIASEFAAMGSEIDRIANATDFNGVKLLCTKMITWYEDVTKFRIQDPGSIANLALPAGKNGTPVLRGVNPNNYVNENNPAKTISVSLTATAGTKTTQGAMTVASTSGTSTSYNLVGSPYSVAVVDNVRSADGVKVTYDGTDWHMSDKNYRSDNDPNLQPGELHYGIGYLAGGNLLRGEVANPNPPYDTKAMVNFTMQDNTGGSVNLQNMGVNDPTIKGFEVDTANNTWSITRSTIEINNTTADYTASYDEANQTVTVRLANGGTATMRVDNPLAAGDTISFDINFEGAVTTEAEERHGVDPSQKLKIHFGPGNDAAEDYYYIKYSNCTIDGLGLSDANIQTQEGAQEALVMIDDAIVAKDKVRADYGAMQNRLENTMTNLRTQAENLQASESRISDSDIAREMMTFVKNQILTQSAVAMLAQANSIPQMVMSLIR